MAYTLQAFIADEAVIAAMAFADARAVRLPQGKAMIPLSDFLREDYDLPFLPLTDGGAEMLPEGIVAMAETMAWRGKVAYVEAEFSGGTGIQACVTWDATGQASQPLVDADAINTALRFLGVRIGEHHDEFDALGLGRHRATGEWLEMAGPGAS